MINIKLIFVLVFSVSLAAACTAREGCTDCVLDSSCGYCSGAGTCLAGNEDGPLNNATCISGWSFDKCLCSAPKSCKVCFEYNCVWCKGWDQKVGMCVDNTYKANATCPLQWFPSEICPSAVDDIALLTFAIVGTGLVLFLIALVGRWCWKNKRGYFTKFKDEADP